MNAPENLSALREMKNHDLVDDITVPACATRSARRRRPTAASCRAVQRLDHARQPDPVQLLHHRHGEGRDPRLPRRVERARRQLRRVHRRRRQGLLHRRQHQGIRRVLRRPPAGVPPVHAAVQRHGQRHPRLRQAGDLPRQRHAHRRRPGDRHGLRLLRRAGPGALRPGRPEHGSAPDRRRHRLPAAVRRHRARHGGVRAVRAVLGAQGLPHGRADRHRAGAQGRRPLHRQPARRRSARSTSSGVSPTASRRAGRRPRKARRCWPPARSTCRCSTPRSRSCAQRCC